MLVRDPAMICPTFDALFSPLVDLPCWGVRHGHGSFVTMQFGPPHQVVHACGPRRPVRTATRDASW